MAFSGNAPHSGVNQSKELKPCGPCGGREHPKRKATYMAVARTDHLLTPAEVAALFRVDPKTVSRWAKAGKISSIRTLGGHRRYRASEIRSIFQPIDWTGVEDTTDSHGAQIMDIRDRRR
jgi:excisionase family DNA binding protein